MSKVGAIDANGNGTLRTLKLNIKFKIERIDGPRADNEPTHRVISDGVEIGAAWTKEKREGGGKFLSITIDDPSFDAPINFAAFPAEDRNGYDVVWNRPRQRDAA